jgi:hypothetical protein
LPESWHKPGFWQLAKWDEEKSEHAAQVWMVGGQFDRGMCSTSTSVSQLWETGLALLYDFHWCTDQVLKALKLYRENQQDTRQ